MAFFDLRLSYVLHSGKRPLIVRLSRSCKVLLQVHHRRAGPQSEGCRFGGPGFTNHFFIKQKVPGDMALAEWFSKMFFGGTIDSCTLFFVCRNKWDVFICHRSSPFNLTKNGGDEVFFHAKRLKGREYSNSCRMGCLYPTLLRWEIPPKHHPNRMEVEDVAWWAGKKWITKQNHNSQPYSTAYNSKSIMISGGYLSTQILDSPKTSAPRSKSWPKRESELHNWGVSHIYPAATKVTRL